MSTKPYFVIPDKSWSGRFQAGETVELTLEDTRKNEMSTSFLMMTVSASVAKALRCVAWKRAKNELKNMLDADVPFYTNAVQRELWDERFKRRREIVERFIALIEDDFKNENLFLSDFLNKEQEDE